MSAAGTCTFNIIPPRLPSRLRLSRRWRTADVRHAPMSQYQGKAGKDSMHQEKLVLGWKGATFSFYNTRLLRESAVGWRNA